MLGVCVRLYWSWIWFHSWTLIKWSAACLALYWKQQMILNDRRKTMHYICKKLSFGHHTKTWVPLWCFHIYIYYMLVLFIPWPSITGPLPPPQKSSDLLSKHIFFYYPLLSIPLSPLYISSFTLFILFSTHRGTHIKCVFVSAACNYYSSYVALFNFRYCDASIVWSLYYIPSVYLLYCLRAAK